MRKTIKLVKLSAFALVVCFVLPVLPVSAAAVRDVPASHFAHTAIERVTRDGIMPADANGYFRPDAPVTKFDAVRVLSRIAGFNSLNSDDVRRYHDRHRGFLNLFHRFSRWERSLDPQIAFLLERGILTRDELNQFVVVGIDGGETVRVVTREQAAVYIVRFLDYTARANSAAISGLYSDDTAISAWARPSVYYLRRLGIMVGSNNTFNPRDSVSNGVLAVIVHNTLNYRNPQAPVPTPTPTPVPTLPPGATPAPTLPPLPTATPTPPPAVVSLSVVQGEIARLFPLFSAIQLRPNDPAENDRVLTVAATASITVDGVLTNFAALEENMVFVGVLSGGTSPELIAVAALSIPAAPTPLPTVTPVPTTIPVEGTVYALEILPAGGGVSSSISVEVTLLSPRGTVTTEVRRFNLAAGASITRGGTAVPLASISVGDVATVHVQGDNAHAVSLEERNRRIHGTLLERRIVELTSTPVLVVEDENGRIMEFTVAENATFFRRGQGSVTWLDLRIGDVLDITTHYDRAVDVFASGTRSVEHIWINSIYISNLGQSFITGVNESNETVTLGVARNTIDAHALRVGSRIRAVLDSREIESFTVVANAANISVSGRVTSVSNTSISIRENTAAATLRTFSHDSTTIIIDASTGEQVNRNRLNNNVTVHIIADSGTANFARTITILG